MKKRKVPQQEIGEQITDIVKGLIDTKSFVIQSQSISTSTSAGPYNMLFNLPILKSSEKLFQFFYQKAQDDPTFANVDVDVKFNKPEILVEINRTKARQLGISAQDIAQTLQLAYSGQRFGYFVMNGKQYQVIGQVLKENRNKPVDLASLYIRNNRNELIQLDNLITMKEIKQSSKLYRFNRYVSATYS